MGREMVLKVPASIKSEFLTNSQVQHILSHQVARDIFGITDANACIEIGNLSCNHFSFTFCACFNKSGEQHNVFIKIPKSDMRGLEPVILPLIQKDQDMCQDEESSLKLLNEKWDGSDVEVQWIHLVGAVPEYNAIITDRIFANEAYAVFRKLDLHRRLGFKKDAKRLRKSMARLGTALGRFHQSNVCTSIFQLSEVLPKFEYYCRELIASTGSIWPARVMEILRSMSDNRIDGIEVPTLKGIDIRNVLIDEKDRLYLLDPGKTKITYREADLARFLMTYRILYWGSAILPFVRQPDPRAETAFLNAYYSGEQTECSLLLSLYMLKEQLKHWHTAINSLHSLHWLPALKYLAERIYVNPFYSRQVSGQLKLLQKYCT